MPLKKYAALLFSVAVFVSACGKKDNTPTPDPVVKPDTLGVGWIKKTIAGETSLTDVFFNSPTSGYMTGSQIYKSTDAGTTWNAISNAVCENIFITNDSKAFFAAQSGNTIYKTIDGGVSFQNFSTSSPTNDVFFVDNMLYSMCVVVFVSIYSSYPLKLVTK